MKSWVKSFFTIALEFMQWIPTPLSSGQQQLVLPFKDTHYPSEKMACCLCRELADLLAAGTYLCG
jgi:hypothetical protein